jgi:2',3'-cyclic-nucleotide 2'-phosphodiesterase (5'-nucleotidase family)
MDDRVERPVSDRLPPALPGTSVRILATTDLGAAFTPVPASFGTAGTCAGVAALLHAERGRQPTVWLDAGDLAVGPTRLLLGRRPWAELAELPLAAAVAGNHEFDDGVPALLEAARSLPFPLLCGNADAGLPASALIDVDGVRLGVIGLTHPASHRFSSAPAPADGWPERVGTLAAELRARGAQWVAGIIHDGVDWWPEPAAPTGPIGTRADRLTRVVMPWSAQVDLILGGHTPGSWTGTIGGVPAGHPHIFAATVLVADLPATGRPVLRGVHRVPPVRPAGPSPAVDALDAAAGTVVAHSSRTWLARTGAAHYLPDLIAAALHRGTGADAAFVPAAQHTTQGAVDGAVAALPAGPVTELDLARLFGQVDDRPAVAQLRRGEFGTLLRTWAEIADPRSRRGDDIWWNWCRMPSGISTGAGEPQTVAVLPFLVPRISDLLGRPVDAEPADVGARQALRAVLR